MENFDVQRLDRISKRLIRKLKPFELASQIHERFCLDFYHKFFFEKLEFDEVWAQKLDQLESLKKGGVRPTKMQLLFGMVHMRKEMEASDKFHLPSTEADPVSSKHICQTPLKQLRPIAISELRSNQLHKGRVLICELFTEVAWVVGLHLGVEDDFGDVAGLTLYNVIPRTKTPETFFPEGTTLYILEPYFKCAYSGALGLRVDNKCNVIIKTPSTEKTRTADGWKTLGNEKFKEGDYASAIECYEKSLETAGKDLKIKCLTNIALCQLKLDDYESALKRCNEALVLHPNDQKAIYRKISALSSLREHVAASELLSPHMVKDDTGWAKLEKRVNRRSRESKGIHDDETKVLIHSGSKDVENFIGPVEVGISTGKGRGVFATENIAEGELIIFEKGISFVYNVEEVNSFPTSYNFETNFWSTPSQQGAVKALINASEIPIIGKRLSYLYDGTESSKKNIPPMSLFKSDRCNDQFGKNVISCAKAEGIETFNSFGTKLDDGNPQSRTLR